MVSLKQIKSAIENLEADGDKSTEYVEAAIANLQTAQEALNTLAVRGRSNVDTLLGCMLAIDMILGEGENNG